MTLVQQDQAHLRACVAVGVEHLDEFEPGWHKFIQVNELDMSHIDRCVVGQLCEQGCHVPTTEPQRRYFESHGFDLDADDLVGPEDGSGMSHREYGSEAWDFLRDLWVKAIAERTAHGERLQTRLGD